MYLNIILLMILIHPSFSALACTLCESERAKRVREAIFGDDFFVNIGIILLPFIIFLIVASLIYYGGSKEGFTIDLLNSNKDKHE
jgi:hypothetical protein